MPRVRKGAARRQSKKRILKAVKGYRGATGKQYRLAKEARIRAGVIVRAAVGCAGLVRIAYRIERGVVAGS